MKGKYGHVKILLDAVGGLPSVLLSGLAGSELFLCLSTGNRRYHFICKDCAFCRDWHGDPVCNRFSPTTTYILFFIIPYPIIKVSGNWTPFCFSLCAWLYLLRRNFFPVAGHDSEAFKSRFGAERDPSSLRDGENVTLF